MLWRLLIRTSVSEYGNPPPAPDLVTRTTITERDGVKCCITGKAGTFRDSLLVVPILPIPSRWIEDKVHSTSIIIENKGITFEFQLKQR